MALSACASTTAGRAPIEKGEGPGATTASSGRVLEVFALSEPAAPLGRWRFANGQAPLEGLAFDMSAESAWAVAPGLRDAMRITLETRAYEELAARLPGLGEGSAGGTRWIDWKSRQGSWPRLADAEWELRFSLDRGLHMVTARFPSEAALRAAVASFGPPGVRGRWEFWVDERSHTRAAFTGCEKNARGAEECGLEFAPIQSLEALLDHLFPGDGTLVGYPHAKLSPSAGLPMGTMTRYTLRALPTTLLLPLEVQFTPDGYVAGYRTALEWIYFSKAAPDWETALRARIEGLPAITTECSDGHRRATHVRVCRTGSQFVITVGTFRQNG